MIGLYVFLNRTRLGRIIRAATQDREMIGALGINVRLLYTGVFALGAWLGGLGGVIAAPMGAIYPGMDLDIIDRKSTRLNSSHANISYAVFCLKKKNQYGGNRERVVVCMGLRPHVREAAVAAESVR